MKNNNHAVFLEKKKDFRIVRVSFLGIKVNTRQRSWIVNKVKLRGDKKKHFIKYNAVIHMSRFYCMHLGSQYDDQFGTYWKREYIEKVTQIIDLAYTVYYQK